MPTNKTKTNRSSAVRVESTDVNETYSDSSDIEAYLSFGIASVDVFTSPVEGCHHVEV